MMRRMTTITRTEAPLTAPEREMLESWLDYHRATLAMKCEGLTDAQLRERSAPPSSLSLLGLVRHLTENELHWFREVLAGEEVPPLYFSDEYPDGEFDLVDDADAAKDLARWREECARSRELIRGVPLDATGGKRGKAYSLRWILVHMIEEYARHNGHADIIRERIDGATGE